METQEDPVVLFQIRPECVPHENLGRARGRAQEAGTLVIRWLEHGSFQAGPAPAMQQRGRTKSIPAHGERSSRLHVRLVPGSMRPVTRYARSGDISIACKVVGEGSIDLVFVMGWVSHIEMFWQEPHFARFLNRLASFSRLILFDTRGTGPSDCLVQLPERAGQIAICNSIG